MCIAGFDPLLELPPLDEFVASMAKQRRALKALILDQVGSINYGLAAMQSSGSILARSAAPDMTEK